MPQALRRGVPHTLAPPARPAAIAERFGAPVTVLRFPLQAAFHREIHEDEEVVAVRVVGGTY
ncbi:hypothetical protein [Streptomyces sp. NPDC004728]|uniref:hypothetical protein n=1 Tax=Streptomyces sp. NPDC004728 TaxID=3154289 RepID=UPI0033AF5F2E